MAREGKASGNTEGLRTWLLPAALLLVFCNALGGAVAVFLAIRAHRAAHGGDRERGRAMARLALFACVATVPLTFITGCSGYGLAALFGGG